MIFTKDFGWPKTNDRSKYLYVVKRPCTEAVYTVHQEHACRPAVVAFTCENKARGFAKMIDKEYSQTRINNHAQISQVPRDNLVRRCSMNGLGLLAFDERGGCTDLASFLPAPCTDDIVFHLENIIRYM